MVQIHFSQNLSLHMAIRHKYLCHLIGYTIFIDIQIKGGHALRIKQIFTGFLILAMLLLSACGTKALPQSGEMSPVEARQVIFSEDRSPESQYWTIFRANNHLGYVIYDKSGEEFIRDCRPGGMFEIHMLDESLIEVQIYGGNGGSLTRYFDIERHLYSAKYQNVLAIDYGKVAYRAFVPSQPGSVGVVIDALVIHDIFDPTMRHDIFKRDYKKDMTPMDFFAVFPFSSVEFVDENYLQVEYQNSKGELVKETLELK